MARSRNIKPGFFSNEDLTECDVQARLLFIGLWTLADREGRLEDRPKRIEAQIFPYEDFDVPKLIDQLETHGFVKRYEVLGNRYILIPKFLRHQNPHKNEKPSEIPSPDSEKPIREISREAQEKGQRDSVALPSHSGLLPLTDSLIPLPSSLIPHSLNPDTSLPNTHPYGMGVVGGSAIEDNDDEKKRNDVVGEQRESLKAQLEQLTHQEIRRIQEQAVKDDPTLRDALDYLLPNLAPELFGRYLNQSS